jgi:diacylglycerol O-acyltransferase / wax synthase
MSEHLTPLDATFLELEQADESAHMHIGAILVFDPPPDGTTPSREQVCQLLEGRLGQLPRYAQRLSAPHTGGLSWPEWRVDPAFEIAKHVGHAALPAPGGDEELYEWASGFFSQRLDRHRPLWEMVLIEGLADGRWALASKTHHCLVDGVGSVDVGHLLLDASPDAPVDRAPDDSAGADRGDALSSAYGHSLSSAPPGADPAGLASLARLARAWAGLLLPVDTVLHVAKAGAHGALHPREALHAARSALSLIVREELRAAPRTSLNEPIGTRRRFAVVRASLDDFKEIKGALGGTVNDVALAATSGALRALLQSRGEPLPRAGLRAMVPMNVRLAGEHLALGNRVSSLFLELPVAEADPARRYRETVSRSRSLKSDASQAEGTTAVIELAGLAPPVIHSTVAQALYATRLFNLTITNVPGPQQTLYAFGAPMREVHPLVPLAAEHAIGVAVVSYDGKMFFGVVADPDTVPDLDVFLNALHGSIGELLALARADLAIPAGGARRAAPTPRSPAAHAS